MKGATEGSETSIAWPSTFAPEKGVVESIDNRRIRIKPPDAGSRLKIARSTQTIFVSVGEAVHINQVIASTVQPLKHSALTCPGDLPKGHIARLLSSRERTQRFSGITLARLRKDDGFCRPIKNLAADEEEDMYVRVEGLSYLSSLCGQSATKWSVWLLGMLPRERVATAVADLQKTAPELHYATTLLWSFVESWISRHWELRTGAGLPGRRGGV